MPTYAYEPTLNPYVPQVLCSNVQVDASVTTVQNVAILAPPSSTTAPSFPANMKFVITNVIMRPAHSINAATTVSLGWTSTSATTTSTTVLSASTGFQSAVNATNVVPPGTTGVGTPGTFGQFLNITFGGTQTSNTTAAIDVIGYFISP